MPHIELEKRKEYHRLYIIEHRRDLNTEQKAKSVRRARLGVIQKQEIVIKSEKELGLQELESLTETISFVDTTRPRVPRVKKIAEKFIGDFDVQIPKKVKIRRTRLFSELSPVERDIFTEPGLRGFKSNIDMLSVKKGDIFISDTLIGKRRFKITERHERLNEIFDQIK